MPDTEEVLGLTGVADVADQIPEDVYSTTRLMALYAARSLAGLITAVRENLSGKAGDTVQVPHIARRTGQGPINPGGALTPVDESTGTYPIQLKKFGDYDVVENEVFEDQQNFDLDAFGQNQLEGLAEKVDQLVYDELETAAAGSVVRLAVAGDLSDIYDKIVDLRAMVKKVHGMRPSHVILGPDQVAQILKDKDQGTKKMQIVAEKGELMSVVGLTVIETSLANPNDTALDHVQGIVIDQRRAVGEAWGRPPNLVVDDKSLAESDQSKIVSWIRYNASDLDPNAIGHIRNPES